MMAAMPLDRTMMYSAVVICGEKLDDADQPQRVRNGTGFILTMPSETVPGRLHGYVVSPDHVVAGLTNVEVEAANPFSRGQMYPPQPVADWRRPAVHPHADLAFAPYPLPAEQVLISLEYGTLVQYGLHVSLGAQCHYVGLLAPLGIPMARSGTIGAVDVPGIEHDGPYEYVSHLIDVRSYDGFSGAPCYVEYPVANLKPLNPGALPVRLPHDFDERPLGTMGYFHLFCGMFTEHFSDRRMPGLASNLGTGIVLPADHILEELMTDELRAERAEEDKSTSAE